MNFDGAVAEFLVFTIGPGINSGFPHNGHPKPFVKHGGEGPALAQRFFPFEAAAVNLLKRAGDCLNQSRR